MEEMGNLYGRPERLETHLRHVSLRPAYSWDMNQRERESREHVEKVEKQAEKQNKQNEPQDLRQLETRAPIVEKKVVVRKPVRRDILKWVEEEHEDLDIPTGEVVGSLLDREQFLKQRITEIFDAVETRRAIHKDIIDEINRDIADKDELLRKTSDLDEERDLKLDISFLRAQKRKENVQFWKDITQLRGQLKLLQEELQAETRIANLFKKFDKR